MGHGASQYTAADGWQTPVLVEMDFDRSPWQQPVVRFDEHAGGGNVDHQCVDAWAYQS
jgi:hypothetical protein